jgi:predicted nucleotidyltransferase
MKAYHFSEDTQEFLRFLAKYGVKYVIVSGEAVIYYGYARLTGDVDFFYEDSQQNAKDLFQALEEFWKGDIPGISNVDELLEPGIIIQFGTPPNRIDLLNKIDAVTFQEAWLNRTTVDLRIREERLPVHFIGLDELIRNKKALKRYKDLEDLRYLRKAREDKER